MNPALLEKFVSRKLIVTVITVLGLVLAKAYVEAAGVAGAFLLSQGYVDGKKVTAGIEDLKAIKDVLVPVLDANATVEQKAQIAALEAQLDDVLAELEAVVEADTRTLPVAGP